MSQEAIRIPTAGAVFWAEATLNADGTNGQRAIAGTAPSIQVTGLTVSLPPGVTTRIRAFADPRGLVLLGPPLPPYNHIPTEADLAIAPSLPAATVGGVALSLDGRFYPRSFSVALPATPTPYVAPVPNYVVLRPSLGATKIGEAGAVVLNVKWPNGTAASWSILLLTCPRNGVNLWFSGQADQMGDVIIPLTGLPPLPPPSQTSDVMTVTAVGDPTQAGTPWSPDPATLKPVQISIGGAFATSQSLPPIQTWGQINNAVSLKIPGITLQSS